ncbi:MAG: pentapeptide repeat-containing protein [Geminocystis sp.]|nr:pentapeptide repeat-containing protein [Geminocystis sp.]HIK37437.1 pentapeptide repeat-containing protein [Geminocystis sp. M7585_C2015_104]MCS7148850.1 pentapeptide repeat-containing protein [Geminocystis sp.]MCX8077407.1 pentapeptide repeat-containing protein [Geminocystis sp.]MDW8115934.1 pentapeptide repeat-containing protein [Geminocystis sp.]
MRKLVGRLGVILLMVSLIMTISPKFVLAASSSAVTSTFESRDLSGEDFSSRNLQSADFTKVKLIKANFSNSDLRGAVFNGVVAEEANFHGADMSNILTYVTSFDGADLTNAILREAIMKRTTFKDAKVDGADFTMAILDKDQVIQLCKRAKGINPVTGASTRQSLGCP